jgi:nitroreductase
MMVDENKLNWRYAVKKFDPDFRLDEVLKNELIEAVRLSPSSMGVQPYHVIVVEDQHTKEALMAASHGQSQVFDSALYLVFATGDPLQHNWIQRHAELLVSGRNIPGEKAQSYMSSFAQKLSEKSSAERTEWATRQAYIALGNIITWCAFYEIDTCPMEGFVPEDYNNILDLNSKGLNACVAIAIGKRHPEDKYGKLPKLRRPQSEFATII